MVSFFVVKVNVYAGKTLDDKPCSSTLVRASREAESVSAGHVQSTKGKGYLSSRGNWNKKVNVLTPYFTYFLKSGILMPYIQEKPKP